MILCEPKENKLSDGSIVYELCLWLDQAHMTLFHCVSLEDAIALETALRTYTVDFD